MKSINSGYPADNANAFRSFIDMLRNNLVPVLIIIAVSAAVVIVYAINAKDIYKATATLKITKPAGSILDSPLTPELQDFGSDRLIANEIEIMKSYTVRDRVARALFDSLQNDNKKFSSILNKDFEFAFRREEQLLSVPAVVSMLQEHADIEQRRGLDIVEISIESPVPAGAALMANCYAKEYRTLNLEQSRNQLTVVKNFLKEQRQEKLNELRDAEELLSAYQQQGGIISLDKQASDLISTLSGFEAQKNAAKIELSASDKVLTQYKNELNKQNPRLADYMESVSSESYFKGLQEQVAKLELNRDMAMSSNKGQEKNAVVKDYDLKIKDLKNKLNEKLEVIKAGIFASSPEQVKDLSQKILYEEAKNQTLKTTYSELSGIVNQYDARFNKLPKTSIELARFQRSRESLEKLYLLVEEKYQEAQINEQSQPGNVLIIDNATVPGTPSKPNRMLIVSFGLIFGSVFSIGFAFVKNYFDNTVKTPEDIEKKNINVLAWIPQVAALGGKNRESDFIVAKEPSSIPSEAFKALRTRVQFSKAPGSSEIKTILVTSSTPEEGKTTVSLNLAGTFAQSNKKTLLIDCDLRKPRVHTVFGANRYPGLIDYLFGHALLDEVIRSSEISNLKYVTAGTIPSNPSEFLNSDAMKQFLDKMKEMFDLIIIDSPPLLPVTDSEIIAQMVDASILVVSAEKTEIEVLDKSSQILKDASSVFIGSVLNNFAYKAGYGAYYKYYYYYSHNPKDKKSSKKRKEVIA